MKFEFILILYNNFVICIIDKCLRSSLLNSLNFFMFMWIFMNEIKINTKILIYITPNIILEKKVITTTNL